MHTIEHINPDGSTVSVKVGDLLRPSIGEHVTIGQNVFLWGGTVIGDWVTIMDGCQFGIDVIIGQGGYIGRDSHLTGTTIGQGVWLEGKAQAEPYVTIGDRVRIGFDCTLGPIIKIEDDVTIGGRFTTVSYTTIKAGAHIGDYVHLDRDITIGEKTIVENGVNLFGQQEVPKHSRVSYQAPLVRVR